MIDYTIVRSNRKTIAIYVRDGSVEVRAPFNATKRAIDNFVSYKANWIREKLAVQINQIVKRENFSLDYGDCITYRGELRPIIAAQGNRIGFDDRGFYMPPNLSPEQVRYSCIRIYQLLAKRDLTERVFQFAEELSIMPSVVKINSAKTRWGSCSTKNSLNFSWRLIMADDDLIDYVVVHELMHLIEMNHSRAFWYKVGRVLPDYKERIARLRELQDRLADEYWD